MSLKHRLWLRQANGPLPDPLPPIRKGCCPSYKRCLSCCNHPNAIYLSRWDWKHQPTFYHELGHWFDYQHLSEDDRQEIRARYGWPVGAWWWEENPETAWNEPNCERFAKAYTRMLLHPRDYKWLRRKLRKAKERA